MLEKNMPNNLETAREFANVVRFTEDTLKGKFTDSSTHADSLKDLFYCNELAISKEVTPELFSCLTTVLDRLGISLDCVEAFVYASPEINAQCFTGKNSNCIIRFSSSLIDILSSDEFMFVVGHELGHFLLLHSIARDNNQNDSVEFYIQQRAQEISADRLGLIACNSLDVTIKALIKTISGLNDNHFRLDVGTFISQLQKTTSSNVHDYQATHPSMLIRCRALLWFSLNESFLNNSRDYPRESLLKLDKKIQSDINKYVDKSSQIMIDEAKNDLSMWMAAFEIVQDDKFSKEEQEQFKESFGLEMFDKLVGFLKNFSKHELHDAVFEKVEYARKELESLIPLSFEDELKTLKKWN